MPKQVKRKLKRLPEGMKARVWFAPLGSDVRDPKVWRLMGVVNAKYEQSLSVYCLARIDPPFSPNQETVRPTGGAIQDDKSESSDG